MSFENAPYGTPNQPAHEETVDLNNDPKFDEQKEQTAKMRYAEECAQTARKTADGIIFRDSTTQKYYLLDQSHGWQEYAHQATQDQWESGTETADAAIAVYTFALRG